MWAKKSLGQHFLKSDKALKSIVNAAELGADDIVLEIGPGHGALTEKLLATGCQLLAVEKDDALYEFLKHKFEKEILDRRLILVHGDILDLDPESYELRANSYKLVANIPYNITGAILEKFLSTDYQPERMVLLVQKEVAERIVARDNKESILSVSVKAYGEPRYVETVKAGSFAPAPKVDSAIIVIENISKQFFEIGMWTPSVHEREKSFFGLVKAGFSSKRKKLSSNLSNRFPKEKVLETFRNLNISENARAEDLSIKVWGELASALCA